MADQEQLSDQRLSLNICLAEGNTPSESDDEEVRDEVERRVAEQERMLCRLMAINATLMSESELSLAKDCSVSGRNNGIAHFWSNSKNLCRAIRDGDQSRHSSQENSHDIDHELELEELQRIEQAKLELAVQQAYDERAAFHDTTLNPDGDES